MLRIDFSKLGFLVSDENLRTRRTDGLPIPHLFIGNRRRADAVAARLHPSSLIKKARAVA